MGHIYRSKSLFDYFKLIEKKATFITKKNNQSELIAQILDPLIFIDKNLTEREELNFISSNFDPTKTILICDGYNFSKNYHDHAKENGFFLVLIDDFYEDNINCDIYLNHSPHLKKSQLKFNSSTRCLLGLKYALINDDFSYKKKPEFSQYDIMLNFGGSDPKNLTNKFLDFILKFDPNFKVSVVIGSGYNHDITQLNKLGDKFLDFKLFRNLNSKDLAELILISKSLLLPCSTILFESLSLRSSALCGFYLDNQRMAYETMEKLNFFTPLGQLEKLTFHEFKVIMNNHLFDSKINFNNINHCFDGMSLRRISNEIIENYESRNRV